jgi:hypothetical protein
MMACGKSNSVLRQIQIESVYEAFDKIADWFYD